MENIITVQNQPAKCFTFHQCARIRTTTKHPFKKRYFMNYFFELSETRRISEANYNTFIRPAFHPDRVMTDHDFLYILDGKWEIMLESSISGPELLQAQTGDLVILPAGLHHYGASPCTPNCKNMYIHASVLPDDKPAAADCDLECSSTDKEHIHSVLLPSVIHCSYNTALTEYFSDIITVCWSDSAWKSRKLSFLFNLLLCEIKEQQEKAPTVSKHMSFVDSVARFLQENPQRFFTTAEVASLFYVSERTLNNRFHEVYHKTLYTWQMEQKLEMVRQFLKTNPGITLRETASNFGFYDEFHLSRVFKKYFGVSPKYVRIPPAPK